MVSHLRIPKKFTEITQFSRDWLNKATNGGKTVKWQTHLGKLF